MSATATKAATNGAAEQATPEPNPFPVHTFAAAASYLRRPFAVNAVKFKVQATWGGGDSGPRTDGLVVAYIDARLVDERLNLVCPQLWSTRFEAQGKAMWCHLTLDGITRPDVGEGYTDAKALVSDALKRAAVHFGVGRSLYAIPKIVLKVSDGHLKAKTVRGKPTAELTAAGEKRCRELYAKWLKDEGIKAFGEPLEHGDSEDAVGDVEAEAPAEEQQRPQRERTPAPVTDADPEQAIAALLDRPDELQTLRLEADKGMRILSAPAAQRLRELESASDERTLKALVQRVQNALDEEEG